MPCNVYCSKPHPIPWKAYKELSYFTCLGSGSATGMYWILVFSLHVLHSWLGRGVIEIPVRVVAEYVKDVRSSRIWDKLLVVRREWLEFLYPIFLLSRRQSIWRFWKKQKHIQIILVSSFQLLLNRTCMNLPITLKCFAVWISRVKTVKRWTFF